MKTQAGSPPEPTKGAEGVPDPEVSAIPKRRTFTAKYKLGILKEVEACKAPGAIGAIVRREGLYSSHLTEWRKQRDSGALVALGKKRGCAPARNPLAEKVEQLQREVDRLQGRLAQAEVIIDVQKKLSSLLGIPLKSQEFGGSA
jgi:transposase